MAEDKDQPKLEPLVSRIELEARVADTNDLKKLQAILSEARSAVFNWAKFAGIDLAGNLKLEKMLRETKSDLIRTNGSIQGAAEKFRSFSNTLADEAEGFEYLRTGVGQVTSTFTNLIPGFNKFRNNVAKSSASIKSKNHELASNISNAIDQIRGKARSFSSGIVTKTTEVNQEIYKESQTRPFTKAVLGMKDVVEGFYSVIKLERKKESAEKLDANLIDKNDLTEGAIKSDVSTKDLIMQSGDRLHDGIGKLLNSGKRGLKRLKSFFLPALTVGAVGSLFKGIFERGTAFESQMIQLGNKFGSQGYGKELQQWSQKMKTELPITNDQMNNYLSQVGDLGINPDFLNIKGIMDAGLSTVGGFDSMLNTVIEVSKSGDINSLANAFQGKVDLAKMRNLFAGTQSAGERAKILSEFMAKEFKGSTDAYLNTVEGMKQKVMNILDWIKNEASVSIFGAMKGLLKDVLDFVTIHKDNISGWFRFFGSVISNMIIIAIGTFKGIFGVISDMFGGGNKGGDGFMKEVVLPWTLFFGFVGILIKSLVRGMITGLKQYFQFMKEKVMEVWQVITGLYDKWFGPNATGKGRDFAIWVKSLFSDGSVLEFGKLIGKLIPVVIIGVVLFKVLSTAFRVFQAMQTIYNIVKLALMASGTGVVIGIIAGAVILLAGAVSQEGSSIGSVFKSIKTYLIDLAMSIVKPFIPVVTGLMKFAGEILSTVFRIVGRLLNVLMPVIQDILANAQQVFPLVMLMIFPPIGILLLLANDADSAGALADGLGGTISGFLGPIISVISAVLPIVLKGAMDMFKIISKHLFPFVKEVAKAIVERLQMFAEVLDKNKDKIAQAFEVIATIVGTTLEIVLTIVTTAVEIVTKLILTPIKIFIAYVEFWVGSVVTVVGGAIQVIVDIFSGNPKDAAMNMWGIFTGLFDNVMVLFGSIFGFIDDMFGGAISAFVNSGIDLLNSLIEKVNSIPLVEISKIEHIGPSRGSTAQQKAQNSKFIQENSDKKNKLLGENNGNLALTAERQKSKLAEQDKAKKHAEESIRNSEASEYEFYNLVYQIELMKAKGIPVPSSMMTPAVSAALSTGGDDLKGANMAGVQVVSSHAQLMASGGKMLINTGSYGGDIAVKGGDGFRKQYPTPTDLMNYLISRGAKFVHYKPPLESIPGESSNYPVRRGLGKHIGNLKSIISAKKGIKTDNAIVSGYRTFADQIRVFHDFLSREPASFINSKLQLMRPGKVNGVAGAAPGNSNHQKGMAIDFGKDFIQKAGGTIGLESMVEGTGLWSRYKKEAWHYDWKAAKGDYAAAEASLEKEGHLIKDASFSTGAVSSIFTSEGVMQVGNQSVLVGTDLATPMMVQVDRKTETNITRAQDKVLVKRSGRAPHKEEELTPKQVFDIYHYKLIEKNVKGDI